MRISQIVLSFALVFVCMNTGCGQSPPQRFEKTETQLIQLGSVEFLIPSSFRELPTISKDTARREFVDKEVRIYVEVGTLTPYEDLRRSYKEQKNFDDEKFSIDGVKAIKYSYVFKPTGDANSLSDLSLKYCEGLYIPSKTDLNAVSISLVGNDKELVSIARDVFWSVRLR